MTTVRIANPDAVQVVNMFSATVNAEITKDDTLYAVLEKVSRASGRPITHVGMLDLNNAKGSQVHWLIDPVKGPLMELSGIVPSKVIEVTAKWPRNTYQKVSLEALKTLKLSDIGPLTQLGVLFRSMDS